jgi:hypothetical protein
MNSEDTSDVIPPTEGELRRDSTGPLLIEIISEGPHCVPCEYAIAAVEYVAEWYTSRILVKILETKNREDAARYLELCARHGGKLPIPAILFNGRLVFDEIPGPDELRQKLDEALLRRD